MTTSAASLLRLCLLPITLLLTRPASSSCIHGTTLQPREIALPKFGYTGPEGPLNWAGLSAENLDCSAGVNQSPINLTPQTAKPVAAAPKIQIANVEAAEFENLGTTVEVIVNGTLEAPGTLGAGTFELKQFHFHTPSEHRINEEYFPLEVHMVHEGPNGALAVMAVLFQMSSTETTALLTDVTKNLEALRTAGAGSVTETGPLDFAPLIQHLTTTPLLSYTGSLTTPPCAEGLTFMVTEKPLPVDVATFNALKQTLKFNARYTQNDANERINVLQLGCDSAVLAAEERVQNLGGGGAKGNATVVRNSTGVATGRAQDTEQRVLKCLMGACN